MAEAGAVAREAALAIGSEPAEYPTSDLRNASIESGVAPGDLISGGP